MLAQPFLLSARVDGGKRRHVPDFLILRRGRVPLVADVKPSGTAGHRVRWLTTAAGPGRLPIYAPGLDDWGRSTSDILRRAQLAALGPNLRPGDQLRYRAAAPAPAVRLDTTGSLARARRHAIPSAFWPAWTARLLRRRSSAPGCEAPHSRLPCSWPAPGSLTPRQPGSSAA